MFTIALRFCGGGDFVWITIALVRTWNKVKRRKTGWCGIGTKGNARVPFSIKYFLVAILFVLFVNKFDIHVSGLPTLKN